MSCQLFIKYDSFDFINGKVTGVDLQCKKGDFTGGSFEWCPQPFVIGTLPVIWKERRCLLQRILNFTTGDRERAEMTPMTYYFVYK